METSEFPERLSVAAELTGSQWSGRLATARLCLDLSAVSGIYYRRPTSFEFHQRLSESERRRATVQARLGLGGLLASLQPWLNHPHQIGYSEFKPVQLRAAVACGLRVPRTVVTNDPGVARAFVTDVGRAVYKPFGGPGVCDADGQFFAARIDATSEATQVDWRSDYATLTYQAIETPEVIRSQVSALLGELGLRFSALDFAVAPDGQWWFLDCNPNGQRAWIEDETVKSISGALADAMEGCPTT